MNRSIARLILLLAAFGLPLAAKAQAFRTYLASYGNDANPCTVTAPCRLLPAALNAVLNGGEVWMLDSANYNSGTVNITKSVSILAVPGQIASVAAAGGAPAISIATGGISVALRNLVIPKNANNPGTDGVSMTNGAMLSVEDCLFANLATPALHVVGTTAVVHVKNTIFRNIDDYAIIAENGPTIDVVNSQLLTTAGILSWAQAASSAATVSVSDSYISDAGEGVFALASQSGGNAVAFITRSTMHRVQYPLDAEELGGGTATVYAGGNMIDGALHAWYMSNPGASVVSYGNNQFSGNGAPTGPLTTNALQ